MGTHHRNRHNGWLAAALSIRCLQTAADEANRTLGTVYALNNASQFQIIPCVRMSLSEAAPSDEEERRRTGRIDDGLGQLPYAPLQHVLHPAGRSKPASNLTPPVARFLAPHTYTQSQAAHSQPERSTSQSVSLSRIPNPKSQASKGIASRKALIIMVRPAALLLLAALAAPACAFVPRAAGPAASRVYTTLPCVLTCEWLDTEVDLADWESFMHVCRSVGLLIKHTWPVSFPACRSQPCSHPPTNHQTVRRQHSLPRLAAESGKGNPNSAFDTKVSPW